MHQVIKYMDKRFLILTDSSLKQHKVDKIITGILQMKLNIKLKYVKIKNLAIQQALFKSILIKLSNESRFLTVLQLVKNHLSNDSILLIIKAGWKFIVEFNVKKCGLNDQSISNFVLLKWPFLRVLNLSLNNIKNKGISILTKCNFPRLQFFICKKINANGNCLKSLIKGQWPRLKQITFCSSQLGFIDCSFLGNVSWRYLKAIDIHSKQSNNVFLWCGYMSKCPQYLKRLKIDMYNSQTKLNNISAIINLSQMYPHANSFCYVWRFDQNAEFQIDFGWNSEYQDQFSSSFQ